MTARIAGALRHDRLSADHRRPIRTHRVRRPRAGGFHLRDGRHYCNNNCQQKAAAPHTVSWKAYGWYHLRSLPGGSSGGGGGASCPSGDGCTAAGNGVAGDPNTLYECGSGKLTTA